ncbi:hypothetical protein BDN70DRAFT_894481 [Pholiota conissans]|uniref:Uncharacterized protein n=1 Tax=Pholiota conissans TaxID=109636 RepID=A0A9P6D179_9AGAR|nr:hypothetical protein BDN70DRAFT_894481 [Pholiota conissans]
MATSAPVTTSVQSSQLCDYCHQKPKFSNHLYCSKTCAGQAAALCNVWYISQVKHCHKKPKFQNFEYCGKNCAALANPGGKSRNPAPAAVAPQHGGGSKQANTNSNGNGTQGAFDPVQLAKLVAQHIPQVQAMFNPAPQPQVQAAPAQIQQQPIISNPFANPAVQVQAPHAPSNNPFLGPGPAAQSQNPTYATNPGAAAGASQQSAAMMNGAPTVPKLTPNPSRLEDGGAHPLLLSAQQPTGHFECLIPGCGQPVHTDTKGVRTSEYCSMRHREEAVAIGLASPCIMCLTFPQSETDYFCSRGCREESLNKQNIASDEEEQ